MSQLDLFEERAAIMEYDGGLSRMEAEHEAARDVVKIHHMTKEQRETFEGLGWSAGKALRFMRRHHD